MADEYITFSNKTQPAINDTNLNLMQQKIKQDIQGAVSGDTLPVGAIMPFGSDTIPDNWLLCDGSEVSRTDYSQLFNTIGTSYGTGDGFTTFNLPDLQGKISVGKDDTDEDFDTLGETGGEKTHTLTVNEMPSHTHNRTQTGRALYWDVGLTEIGGLASGSNVQSSWDISTTATGGSQAHNNLQPYTVTNYIIKAKQSSGVVATVVDTLDSTSATNALSANMGRKLAETITGTTLYDGGTNGTVTLSDSVANYDYVEIFFRNVDDFFSSVKVYSPDGKKVVLIGMFVSEGGYSVCQNKIVSISGSSIAPYGTRYGESGFSGDSLTHNNNNYIYINRVIGYKLS